MRINRFNGDNRIISDKKIDKKRRKKKDCKEEEKILFTARWQRKREFIKKRDHYFCQRCWGKYGKHNSERLEVHHIKNRLEYPELAFDDDNLITICKTCNLELGSAHELDFDWKPMESELRKEDFIL